MDVCVCGQLIPETVVYYAFPLDEDNDSEYAYVNEWHDPCLDEWGWVRDGSEFGITHASTYCVEEAAEDIRAS